MGRRQCNFFLACILQIINSLRSRLHAEQHVVHRLIHKVKRQQVLIQHHNPPPSPTPRSYINQNPPSALQPNLLPNPINSYPSGFCTPLYQGIHHNHSLLPSRHNPRTRKLTLRQTRTKPRSTYSRPSTWVDCSKCRMRKSHLPVLFRRPWPLHIL
jgi:hypothetical protein